MEALRGNDFVSEQRWRFFDKGNLVNEYPPDEGSDLDVDEMMGSFEGMVKILLLCMTRNAK